MAHQYVTADEVKSLLGITGQDALIDDLIDGAEALFNSLIGSETGLISSDKTEDFPVDDQNIPWDKRNRVFHLQTIHPTEVTSINGVAAGTKGTDYILKGQRLELKTAPIAPTSFPYQHKIIYKSGWATAPEDVKIAIKYIVGGLYSTRKSQGISSFKQDLLSVNYKDKSVIDTILDPSEKNFVQAIIQNYTYYFTLA